jgi:hypothetical protein
MEKLKNIIMSVAIVVLLTAGTAHGATTSEVKAEIKLWESYIVKLELILEQLRDRVESLESQIEKKPVVKETRPVEYRFTLVLPENSPVAQPKDDMTLQELREFTANLYKRWESSHRKYMNAEEEELVEFLETNGYKVSKDRI